MHKLIDAISDSAKKLIAIQGELKELDSREAQLSKEAQSLADQSYDKAISSIRGQRTTTDYLSSRRSRLQGQVPHATAKLRKAIKDCDDHWTAIIAAHRDQTEQRFYTVNAEFYEGSVKEARQALRHMTIPAWNNHNAGIFHFIERWDAPETIIDTARAIIVHIEKHLPNYNIAILD